MTYLPLRVNSGGVIPPIFASSLLTFPAPLPDAGQRAAPFLKGLPTNAELGRAAVHADLHYDDYSVRVFLCGIVFNPTELADNMRKYGGFIPGIRPGRNTSEHVSGILKRLDVYRRRVPGAGLPAAGMDDRGYSPAALADWLGGDWFDRHVPHGF